MPAPIMGRPDSGDDRLRRDLHLARRIQELLQGATPPELPGIQVTGASLPARSLGGDYYDFLVRNGRVRVIIADVMGKGVGAAMQMAMTRTAAHMASGDCDSPGELLERINRILYPDLRRLGSFLTMFCADFAPDQETLICASAGHPSPLVWRAATSTVESIPARGIVIGAVPEVQYAEATCPVTHQDTVLFFTDGVVEMQDTAGGQLKVSGLIELLCSYTWLTVEHLRELLLLDLLRFASGAPQHDDITLALLQVNAQQEAACS